ncbi:MAG: hypothetical protein J5808_02125 [Paludibacteraceae bacterium]|nr:hypothetical protein [Paludibacteraceae bacterium]
MKKSILVLLMSFFLLSCEKEVFISHYIINLSCSHHYQESVEKIGPLQVIVRETYPEPERRLDTLYTDSFGKIQIKYYRNASQSLNWSGILTVTDPSGTYLPQRFGFDWQGTKTEKPNLDTYVKNIHVWLQTPEEAYRDDPSYDFDMILQGSDYIILKAGQSTVDALGDKVALDLRPNGQNIELNDWGGPFVCRRWLVGQRCLWI